MAMRVSPAPTGALGARQIAPAGRGASERARLAWIGRCGILLALAGAMQAPAQAGSQPTAALQPLRFALIKEGVWYSLIAEHSNKALAVAPGAESGDGAPLQQITPTGADNELFRFDQVRSGYFKIVVKSTGKVVEVKDNSMLDHARVVQGDWAGGDNQMFTLVQDTDGSFQIVARSNGYALDVLGGAAAIGDGVPVIVYPPFAAKNHKFRLVEAPPPAGAGSARLP